MAGSDVKSATATASGTLFAGPARLRHVMVKAASTGTPQIVFKDGGASGTTVLTADFVTSSNQDIPFPDEGMKFSTDVYVALTNIDRITILYS